MARARKPAAPPGDKKPGGASAKPTPKRKSTPTPPVPGSPRAKAYDRLKKKYRGFEFLTRHIDLGWRTPEQLKMARKVRRKVFWPIYQREILQPERRENAAKVRRKSSAPIEAILTALVKMQIANGVKHHKLASNISAELEKDHKLPRYNANQVRVILKRLKLW